MAIVDLLESGLGIVRSESDITAEWVQGLLHGSKALESGVTVTGITTERIGEGVGVLSIIQRVTPAYSGATKAPATIVIKYPTDDPTQRFTADVLTLYVRELEFYKQVAPDSPFRAPRCFAAAIAENNDFTVVMEDIGAYRACNQLDGMTLDEARAVISDLADFHATWWNSPRLPALEQWFQPISNPTYHAMLPQLWQAGWPFATQHASHLIPDGIGDLGEKWPERISWMLEEMMHPHTLLHGDCRADNIFFDGNEPVLLDFQISGTGVGVYDIAYLVSQSLKPEVRKGHDRELVDTYIARLEHHGIEVDSEDMWRKYRIAVVMCVTYAVTTFPSYEAQNERGKQLIGEMFSRALQAVVDSDAWSAVTG